MKRNTIKKAASMLIASAALAGFATLGSAQPAKAFGSYAPQSTTSIASQKIGTNLSSGTTNLSSATDTAGQDGTNAVAYKNFTPKTSTGTSKFNSEGYAALTQGSKNEVGYVTSNQKLNFEHDWTITGNAYFGSRDGSYPNLKGGPAGDGFNFLFSSENPQEVFAGRESSAAGGYLGMQGLSNAFGLAFDEHYNTQDQMGDFRNQLFGPGMVRTPTGVTSWRTTSPEGNLNSNARILNWGLVDAARSKDPNAQVVSMNPSLMDGKGHMFVINYNAETSTITVTVPDNLYNFGWKWNAQNIYKNTGAINGGTWTRTVSSQDKKDGLYLSFTGTTGDKAYNNFGVQVRTAANIY
ncbi:hypothetical protein [Lentilactobacillus sp. Marseille-Q4993]|uniref:lectin-like domain-containing protein n=1 Tax=Lentilactobacillus sp. Marseille-Q4993 TaxID=3039492 RepID=UPI0024BD0873|nr:hypothetical protein [Lentilactobacillus sp. Marseille-Q4993]